jgi:site-specific DNA recombinase
MTVKDKKEIKYVIYARRSIESRGGEDERGVPSIDSQLTEIKKHVSGQGLKIVKEFVETKSASKPYNRPAFDEMIKLILDGKADGILCFKMDRLARNPIDDATIRWLLQKGQIKNVKSCDRDWYQDESAVMTAIEFSMANQYVIDLIKHIKRGQAQATSRGFRPSIAPIGYKNSKYREEGQLEEVLVDEERFQILRKMFDYILTGGYTPHEVHKMATEEWGMRTRPTRRYPIPKPMSMSSWYNILSNPFYYGEFEYPRGSDNWFKGNHTPLISRDEYDAIQVILGRAAPRPKVLEHKYTGLLKCGECGLSLTCVKKTKRQKNGNVHNYSYYYCTGRARKGCSQGSMTETVIEEQVLEFLSSLRISPAFHQWAMDELKKEHEREKSDRTCILHNQQTEYKRVCQKLDSLFEMRLNKELESDDYIERKKEYESEQRRLKTSLDSIDARIANWFNNAERLMTFAERAVEEFKNGDLKKQKTILSALGHTHIVKDGVIRLQTEKPLHVWQEVVLQIIDEDKMLEPANDVASKGYSKKIWVLDTKLWKTLYQVRTSLIEMECANFLKIVDLW